MDQNSATEEKDRWSHSALCRVLKRRRCFLEPHKHHDPIALERSAESYICMSTDIQEEISCLMLACSKAVSFVQNWKWSPKGYLRTGCLRDCVSFFAACFARFSMGSCFCVIRPYQSKWCFVIAAVLALPRRQWSVTPVHS